MARLITIERKHRKYVLLAVIVVIILIVCVLYYFFESRSISALEGKTIADKVAKEWSSNAKIVSISGEPWKSPLEGKSQLWTYRYIRNITEGRWEYLHVSVDKNFQVVSREVDIHEWSEADFEGMSVIDSATAYEIAIKYNRSVSNFFKTWPRITVDAFSLSLGNWESLKHQPNTQ